VSPSCHDASTSTAYPEERSTERVRGAVKWPATLAARSISQLPTLYVTNPAERAYQTPENELLVFVLNAIVDLGTQTGWIAEEGPQLAQHIRHVTGSANHALSNRMLLDVARHAPTPRAMARVRSGRSRRRYQSVLDVYDLYQELIERLTRSALRDLIERTGLLTRSDATLFELLRAFGVIDGLCELGWQTSPLRVIEGSLQLHALRDHERLDVWYQTTPRELRRNSRYVHELTGHGFRRPQDLRPDIVMRHTSGDGYRWLIIEAKMGERRRVAESIRAALIDLLAYRQAFRSELASNPLPYGLGIAWGADLNPTLDGEVMLCTPDHVTQALASAFG
jgi:hypothetical protein